MSRRASVASGMAVAASRLAQAGRDQDATEHRVYTGFAGQIGRALSPHPTRLARRAT